MLVGQKAIFKIITIAFIIYCLENFLKSAIIVSKHVRLSRQYHWELFVQPLLEARMCEVYNRINRLVLGLKHPSVFIEVE